MKHIFLVVSLLGLAPGLFALLLCVCTFPQASGVLDKLVKGNSNFGSFYKVSGKGVLRQFDLTIAFRLLDHSALAAICIAIGICLYLIGMCFFLFRR